MKFLFHTQMAAIVAFGLLFLGCKKDQPPETSYGTLFESLLKTVTTTNGHTETRLFRYDAQNRLYEIEYQYSAQPGLIKKETWYRSANGLTDSIVLISSGTINNYVSSRFYYTPGGLYRYSIQRFNYDANNNYLDSSVYVYSGSQQMQRTDYRQAITGGSVLVLSRTFTYDAAGNLASMRTQGSGIAATDIIYEYDNKVNPLPHTRDIDYFGPGWYHDRVLLNNPTRLTLLNVSPAGPLNTLQSQYRYLPNNKPYYRSDTDPGSGANSVTEYFYN
jgi:hypothetical protein